jgi:hypothetical protein
MTPSINKWMIKCVRGWMNQKMDYIKEIIGECK